MVQSVALLAVALSASNPNQFDLICTGTETTHWNLQSGPITSHYRIDLKANHWCQGECQILKSFAEASPTQLVFDEVKAAYRGDPTERLDFVRRDTGEWNFFNHEMQGDGSCVAAPFSGFPSAQTKF
jgi:hypothetical protein